MKQKQPSMFNYNRTRRYIPILWFFVSFLLSLISGIFLFGHGVFDGLSAAITSTGLDSMRSQLITALMLTAGSALTGALFTHRKSGGMVGASIVFVLGYLVAFIQTELVPVTDAGGHIEPLQTNVLYNTCFIMVALAILSALIGAAVGSALYEILLYQPYQVIRALWQRFTLRDIAARDTAAMHLQARLYQWHLERWVAIIVMLGLFFLASQSGNLFIISPEADIHGAPKLNSIAANVPSFGTTKVVEMQSILMKTRRLFEIYLPPTYNTPAGKNKRYPTAYLLHGSPGKVTDWVLAGRAAESADALIDTKKIPELIMVMPDGNGAPGTTSEWGNSGNNKQPLEDFVSKELVKYVDQHYRTIPDAAHRAIGGLSMGGFGAMNIAIHHPDVFHSVIALGGYYNATGPIWGHSITYRQYNSPIIQIVRTPQAKTLQIFLGDATEDKLYYPGALKFAATLKKLGIKYTFVREPGGHSWKVWGDELYEGLEWVNWGPIHNAPQAIHKP
ncbi:alpha/beta hydrolase [Dictyobacter aurantiacus]|nr:alpha/beta hydrolase family protein [Dictyobacter aurantiacus]